MNSYKVPQDVEADDKLLGPFTFRQFIYLIILSGLLALSWALANLFIPLALIPLPLIALFAALALPLKKDQPMETYLAAVVSFYTKPRTRIWMPGQRNTTITISAPKIIERPRTRNISSQEANHRLSFLANIVDSEGYAIHNNSATPIRPEFLAEASTAPDIFAHNSSPLVNQMLAREEREKRTAAVSKMKNALLLNQSLKSATHQTTPPPIAHHQDDIKNNLQPNPQSQSPQNIQPPQDQPNPRLAALAHDPDYTIATISKEATRITTPNLNYSTLDEKSQENPPKSSQNPPKSSPISPNSSQNPPKSAPNPPNPRPKPKKPNQSLPTTENSEVIISLH